MNTICINSFCYQRDYQCDTRLKIDVASDEGKDSYERT